MLSHMGLGIRIQPLFCRSFYLSNVINKYHSVITRTSPAHTAVLIFLHGMADTGHDWHNTLSQVCGPHIKVICPHAPVRPSLIYKGKQMPSWFNIKSLDFGRQDLEDEEERESLIKASYDLQKIIEGEVDKGIPHNRIIIGGFSQGGTPALEALLNIDKKLGGCIGLNTVFPPIHLRKHIGSVKVESKETPVFLAHGVEDDIMDVRFARMMKDILKTEYSNVTWKENKGMKHYSVEMKNVAEFVRKVIPCEEDSC